MCLFESSSLILSCLPASAQVKQAESVTLAILPFENLTGQAEDNWIGLSCSEGLTGILAQAPGLQLIERSQIQALLKEQLFSQTALVDSQQAPSLGKLIGAKRLLLGSYQREGKEFLLQVRAINVETGQIEAGSIVRLKGPIESLVSLQETMGQTLLNHFQRNSVVMPPSLTPTQVSLATAKNLYFRALYILDNEGAAGLLKAEKILQQALNQDSHSALVQTGLARVYLTRGSRAKSSETLQTALHWAESALRSEPKLVAAHLVRANILSTLNQPEAALSSLETALQAQPHQTEIILALLDLQRARQEKPLSHQALKTYLLQWGADFENPEIQMTVGINLVNQITAQLETLDQSQAEFALAIQLLEKAGQGLPDQPNIPLTLAEIYYWLKQPEQVQIHIQKALAIDPENFWVLLNGGSHLGFMASNMSSQNPETAKSLFLQARQYLEKAIKINPHFSNTYARLADVYENLGDTNQAQLALRQALKEDPENTYIYTSIAQLYSDHGQLPEALEALLRAQTLAEKAQDTEEVDRVKIALVDIYLQQKAYTKAKQLLNPLAEQEKYRLSAWMSLQEIYAQEKDNAARLAVYEHIFKHYPEFRYQKQSLLALIEIQMDLNNNTALLQTYTELFQHHPEFKEKSFYLNHYKSIYLLDQLQKYPEHAADILNDLGQTMMAMDANDQAQEYLEMALKEDPEHPVIHYNLGVIQLKTQNPAAAIKYFERALALRPKYVNAAYNLGLAYIELKQMAQARLQFEQVLQWQPGHAAAKAALESLP
jgi:tetratricopeptide (TPR) repeat protein